MDHKVEDKEETTRGASQAKRASVRASSGEFSAWAAAYNIDTAIFRKEGDELTQLSTSIGYHLVNIRKITRISAVSSLTPGAIKGETKMSSETITRNRGSHSAARKTEGG